MHIVHIMFILLVILIQCLVCEENASGSLPFWKTCLKLHRVEGKISARHKIRDHRLVVLGGGWFHGIPNDMGIPNHQAIVEQWEVLVAIHGPWTVNYAGWLLIPGMSTCFSSLRSIATSIKMPQAKVACFLIKKMICFKLVTASRHNWSRMCV